MTEQRKKPKVKKTVLLIVAVLLVASAVPLSWFGNKSLCVSEFIIESDSVPIAFSGFCIVQISDLHNAEFGKDNSKLTQMIEEASPDIIVITGDFIDGMRTNVKIASAFAQEAVKLAPVYFVAGNHEARVSRDIYNSLIDSLISAGVTVLDDTCDVIEKDGEHITLLGLTDPFFRSTGSSYEETAESSTQALAAMMPEDGGYTVLLSHRPELFHVYVNAGVNLAFTGHAHGGQVRLPVIGGLYAPNQGIFPKFDAGAFSEGNTTMLVSRGLGNSVAPIRINDRPEIVVAKLMSK